jgi:two-component system nitrate/nitrite response regulator NarL
MKTVCVYSASPVLSQGLRVVLRNDFSVHGLFESLAALEDQLTTERPDILVAEMSPAITFATLKHLRTIARTSQIVLWFDSITPEFVSACLSLGIRGVISKSASVEAHVRCLTEVASGNLWIDQALSQSLMTTRAVRLTPRERQLFGLLVQGLSNKEIAWALDINQSTVKVYLSRLFPKVGANDRFELALMGLKYISGNSAAGSAPPRMPGKPAIPLEFPETIQMRPAAGSAQFMSMPRPVLQMPRRPAAAVMAPGPLRPVYAARA